MYKCSAECLDQLFARIAESETLYMPLEKNGQVHFGRWPACEKVRLDKLNTVKSAKALFFPQSENLVAFKVEKQTIAIVENREDVTPFVLFGVRACDSASFDILDRVFLKEPVDTYYKARREKGTVVTLACRRPEETCFCGAFQIDPSAPRGDVQTWLCGGTLYWESLTPKGSVLTEKLSGLLEEADGGDEAHVSDYRASINDLMEKMPLHGLSVKGFGAEAMNELFDSPMWAELSEACLGCGTCTYLCPTCQCYDIRDYDTGHGIMRYRCWDSCMYSDFTKMAAENPRKSQLERFRQRFMHKLVYFPENNGGTYACVGCGRCLAGCPVSMNIVKVYKALGGREDE